MKFFAYVFLLFVILEGIYCNPFWNLRHKNTELRFERHNQVKFLGMTYETHMGSSGTNTPLARFYGMFVPPDTQVWHERNYHVGIPGFYEVRGHRGFGVDNY